MIESRLFLYTAIAVLSLSFTVLGYFSLASSPHFGAILGFLSGGALSALLSQNILMFQSYQKHGQHNQKQQQILEQLEMLSHSLKSWNSQVPSTTDMTSDEMPEEEIPEEPKVFVDNPQDNSQNVSEPDFLTPSIDKAEGNQVGQRSQFAQWLKSQQAKLLSFENEYSVSKSPRITAEYIVDNYKTVSALMQKIRETISRGNYNGFDLKLDDKNQTELSDIEHLGQRLQNANFLNYKYHQKTKYAKVSSIRAKNSPFLTGEWLEVALRRKITRLFQERQVRNYVISNAKISVGQEEVMEIDIASLVNGQPLLMECQITVRNRDISAYADFCKKLNLKSYQIYFVSPEVTPETAKSLSETYQIQVVNASHITAVLDQNLNLFTT